MAMALFRAYSCLGWTTGQVVDLLFFRRLEWRAVRRFLRAKQGDLVLDVACGGGNGSRRMAEAGARVIAFDIDFPSLRYAAASCSPWKVRLVCADAQAMPFRTGVFDQAFSICSLEHFEDDQRALDELARVLKSGGSAALTVDSLSYPDGFTADELSEHMRKHTIRRRYMLPDLASKVVASGFRVEDSSYLVNSPVSNHFFVKYAVWASKGEHPNRLLVLFPLIYPMALISDLLFAIPERGHILAVKIRRE